MLRKPLWHRHRGETPRGPTSEETGDDDRDTGTDDDADEGDDDEGDDDDDGEGEDTPCACAEAADRDQQASPPRDEGSPRLRRRRRATSTRPRRKAAAKWKPRVVNSAAKAALLAAGAEKPERLLKLLNHDDLDVTDTGDVDGLDDEVDRLRDEYPELFKRRAGALVGSRRATVPARVRKKPQTASERQAASMTCAGDLTRRLT